MKIRSKVLLFLTPMCILLMILYQFSIIEFPNIGYNFENPNIEYQDHIFHICKSSSSSYNPVLRESTELWRYVKNHPNIPSLLLGSSNIPSYIPDVYQIRWSGVLWQESWANSPKFYLYSAHFDDREKYWKRDYKTYIRVLSMYDGVSQPRSGFCQLHFNKTRHILSTPIQEFKVIDWQGFSKAHLVPYMISCLVPKQARSPPIAISLSQHHCDKPTNVLNITGLALQFSGDLQGNESRIQQTEPPSLAVCDGAVRSFEVDYSHRLIEWVELMFLLGVSKILLYRLTNHPNVDKVLDYYEQNGKVQIILFRFPPPYVDQEAFRQAWISKKRPEIFALENIFFTDCVLRLKDEFRYVAHFDHDEVPVLKKYENVKEFLTDMIAREDQPPASYKLLWRTFYPDVPPGNLSKSVPERFHILRHNKLYNVYNSVFENNGKSIYDTKQVLGIYSHDPLFFVDGANTKKYVFKKEEAYTAHYRYQKCGKKCSSANSWEEEKIISHKYQLISNVNKVLKDLNIPYED